MSTWFEKKEAPLQHFEYDEDEYIPEKILKVRRKKGVLELFMLWKGYEKEDASWISEEELQTLDPIFFKKWKEEQSQKENEKYKEHHEIHKKKITRKLESKRINYSEQGINAFGVYDISKRKLENDLLSGNSRKKEKSFVPSLKKLSLQVIADNIRDYSLEGVPANIRYGIYKNLITKKQLTHVSQIEALLDSQQTHLDLSEAPKYLNSIQLWANLPNWVPKITLLKVPQTLEYYQLSIGSEVLYNALLKFKNITVLDITGIDTSQILPYENDSQRYNQDPPRFWDRIMVYFPKLKHLRACRTKLRILPKIHQHSELEFLDLNENPLLDTCSQIIRVLQTQKKLKILKMGEPVTQQAVAAAKLSDWENLPENYFRNHPENGDCSLSLEELDINHLDLTRSYYSEKVDHIQKIFFITFVNLKRIDLSFTDISTSVLDTVVQCSPKLEILNLSSLKNPINFNGLRQASNLLELDLSHNELLSFISVFRSFQKIENLNLSYTRWFDSPWKGDLPRLDILKNPSPLKKLNLENANWINENFLRRGVLNFWKNSLIWLSFGVHGKNWEDELVRDLNEGLLKECELVTELSE